MRLRLSSHYVGQLFRRHRKIVPDEASVHTRADNLSALVHPQEKLRRREAAPRVRDL